MTNMVTPKERTPTTRKHQENGSSSNEESEELDYTISPKTQFFPDRISTLLPPKRFHDDTEPSITPIDRPLALYDYSNKAKHTPGDKRSQQVNPPQRQTWRDVRDLLNYLIKTRQSTFEANPVTSEQQYLDITVSKTKQKDWVSWKETMIQ